MSSQRIVHAHDAFVQTVMSDPRIARELIDRYFLKPFQLIDLGRIDDEELKRHAWVGVIL